MSKINSIKFNNYRAFHGKSKEINLDGKNLLVWGENGSGKSSFFKALNDFVLCKTSDTHQQNKFSIDNWIINLNIDGTNYDFEATSQITDLSIKNCATVSPFLDYRKILSLYFSNKSDGKELNLLNIFEKILADYPILLQDSKKIKEFGNELNDFFRIKIKTENVKNNYREKLDEYKSILSDLLNVELKPEIRAILRVFNLNFDIDSFELSIVSHLVIPDQLTLKIKTSFFNQNIEERYHDFLNEARLSALSISVYFAAIKKLSSFQTNMLNILVIDDLLLSLDMSNRNKVLEILFSSFNNYQIIMLTHDKYFFEISKNYIQRMGEKEKWEYFEMYEKIDVNGVPTSFITESRTYLEKAEIYFNKKEYEIAGNFLRKEAEEIFSGILPIRLQCNENSKEIDLKGLVDKGIKYFKSSKMSTSIISELDSYRKFVLNPSSHSSYDVPKFNSEIAKSIETIKNILKFEIKSVLKNEDRLEFSMVSLYDGSQLKFEILIWDDFKLIKEPGLDSILSVGRINYTITRNGNLLNDNQGNSIRYKFTTLKEFYDEEFNKSDRTQPLDFWEGIILKSNMQPIRTIRLF